MISIYRILFLGLFFSSYSPLGFSQAFNDSIILLNGVAFKGDIESVEGDFLHFKEKNKRGIVLDSRIETYRVFSYTSQGKETVLYKQNEEQDNFLTVVEAKNATLGSYDARQTFKPRVAFWSTLLIGYGVSLYDTYLMQSSVEHPDYVGPYTTGGFFKRRPTLLPVLVPIVFSAGWSIPSFKIKEKQMIQKHLLNNESYYRGYHRVARQKRILGALKGGLIGIGAGFLTYAVLK